LPKVEWGEEALADLEKIDRPIAKRILHEISWFSKYFDAVTPEPLSADMSGLFKLSRRLESNVRNKKGRDFH